MFKFSVREKVDVEEQWNSSSESAWRIGKFCGFWSTDLNISYQRNNSLEEEIEYA